jgi:uncharacterized membrane protein
MEEHTSATRITLRIEPTDLTVAPGSSTTLPLFLHNHDPSDDSFELTVRGIPSNWVSTPSPVVRLAAGEQREVHLTIQPPSLPHGGAGRHSVAIRAASQSTPQKAAEASCTLTVAALEVPGRIGLLLASLEFSVAPGDRVTVPLVLFNQGLEADIVRLSVEGIPSSWVYASSASTPLSPGQQQEVTLTIQPPRSLESAAGRHPLKILAASQGAPGQVTAAECVLTIATFSQFGCELRPQRIEAGEPARVAVENRGNIQQVFTLDWRSPEEGLSFEPAPTQEMRVPPGEVGVAEFSAKPRSRPLLGGERVWPFSTRVQAAGGDVQNLNGEVVGKALIPSWVLPAILVAILAVACVVLLVVVVGGLREGAPPEAPAASATPAEEQPAPTEPPAEVPTEAPPEEPPTEAPPEEPTEEPPEAGQLPAGPGEGGLPCAPLAAGLTLAPLAVVGKKRFGK